MKSIEFKDIRNNKYNIEIIKKVNVKYLCIMTIVSNKKYILPNLYIYVFGLC